MTNLASTNLDASDSTRKPACKILASPSTHLSLEIDGVEANFHWFVLRHHCPDCIHPKTKERLLDAVDICLDVQAKEVFVEGETLVIVWDEKPEHRSTYELDWLRQNAYAKQVSIAAPPSASVDRITLNASDYASVDALREACLACVRENTAVVVRGFGDNTEEMVQSFERAGLPLIETHFGRIEDLRTDNTTNKNTDQLGYTDSAIGLHSDQPFLEEPPRYQLLHCMRAADQGGDNDLVDARTVVAHLRATDRHAFDLLSSTSVRFHRKQKAFERIVDSPILELDENRRLVRIRHSYFTFAPFQLPFERMKDFYRAYQTLGRLLREHAWRVKLDAGDFVLYDNQLALHARTGFTGGRWVRGVYFGPKPADWQI